MWHVVISLIPLIAFIILRFFCARFFFENKYVRFALPEAWLMLTLAVFHVWCVFVFGYSLIEYVLFVYGIIGLLLVAVKYRYKQPQIPWYHFLKKYTNAIFLVSVIGYFIWLGWTVFDAFIA